MGALFLAAAALKAMSPSATVHSIAQGLSGLALPPAIAAGALIAIETAVGLSLLFVRWTSAPLGAFVALLIAFTGWLIALELRHPGASCGCLSPASIMSSAELPVATVRNLAFLTACAASWRLEVARLAVKRGESP